MSLFQKLEHATEEGLVLIAETTTLVRLAIVTLRALEPTVKELPTLVQAAKETLGRVR